MQSEVPQINPVENPEQKFRFLDNVLSSNNPEELFSKANFRIDFIVDSKNLSKYGSQVCKLASEIVRKYPNKALEVDKKLSLFDLRMQQRMSELGEGKIETSVGMSANDDNYGIENEAA